MLPFFFKGVSLIKDFNTSEGKKHRKEPEIKAASRIFSRVFFKASKGKELVFVCFPHGFFSWLRIGKISDFTLKKNP